MRARTPWNRSRAAVLASMLVALVATACTSSGTPPAPTALPAVPARPVAKTPNIVFVLTDDLSMDLVPYMPHVIALGASGATFTNYSVTDSLCCPSRSSILTGRFPHDTHVYTNGPPGGGMAIFNRFGGPATTYAVALQNAGYRTALLGKYMNGYLVGKKVPGLPDLPTDYVPPGWSTWAVGDSGYKNFNYKLNQDGKTVSYGHRPADYLTRVITKLGVDFIQRSVHDRKPFAMELATYSPHLPYTPDPIDLGSFADLKAPRVASFDRKPANMPPWLRAVPAPLTPAIKAWIDEVFVKRVEAVQSVDRAIGTLQATLRETGQLANTVFVFSSDNGYHLGQHGLREGKRTAFDTDVHVPLVVAGPGVTPGTVDDHVVQNIDLAPTFEQLAGQPVAAAVDGRSLVPLLRGRAVPWRTRALVEHHGAGNHPGDPDQQAFASGNPPTYNSLRGPDWTYTRYSDGEREYYNRRTDPAENVNLAGTLTRARIAELDGQLQALQACHGGAQCWMAGMPQRP
jgi:N-acetylglucosamine-6-sulfatase